MTQTLLSSEPETEESGIFPWKHDDEECMRKLTMFILIDELPFSIVEFVGFREFFAALNPRFIVPSKMMLKRDVMRLYEEEKSKLKEFFVKSKPRVCLTTNIWTSLQQISYMSITVHYIDDDWKLMKKLINFVPIDSHSGENIQRCITRCLDDWGIDKIFTVTVDNAPTNELVDGLKLEFGNRPGGVLSGAHMMLRCAADIAKLVCEDGLELQQASISVQRIREAVRYVKSSTKRLKKFKKCMIKEGDLGKMELTLDVETRWNSTYMMLEAARRHEKVWKRYMIYEKYFAQDMAMSDSHGVPTSSDWDYAHKLCDFLEYFYDFTTKVSNSSCVTSNWFYFEMANLHYNLKMWINGDDIEMSSVATRMKQKLDEYWGQTRESIEAPQKKPINLLLFVGTILDPRFKLSTLEQTLHYVYEGQMKEDVLNDIQLALKSLYEHYKEEFDSSTSRTTTSTPSTTVPQPSKPKLNLLLRILNEIDAAKIGAKSDLEVYLEEPRIPFTDEEFDILGWWRNNAGRLPILAQMARDVLAIPISTVPYGSAFNTKGRVLDAFRSSLSFEMVEAVMCCQDWMKRSTSDPTDVDDVDEECDEAELMLPDSTTSPSEGESLDVKPRQRKKGKGSKRIVPKRKRRKHTR